MTMKANVLTLVISIGMCQGEYSGCEQGRIMDARINASWLFNPTVTRYAVATGRPNGHKAQKCSLCDAKSGRRDEMRGTKPALGRGHQGLEVW